MARQVTSLVSTFALSLALGACNVTTSDGGDADEGDGAREGTPFFLPTGEPDNTSAPTVEIDAKGGVHMVYPAYAGGRAYYAYCPKGCSDADDVSVVQLATDASVANIMIALDGSGRPQVLISSVNAVYYARPEGKVTDAASWKVVKIIDHQGAREVSGEAFALDPQGNPRFMMHTYVAYLGIGQKAPETFYVTADGDPLDPASWSQHLVATQIWQSSALRFDAQGNPHVATVAHVVDDQMHTNLTGAYLTCTADCTNEASWVGSGLLPAFSTDFDAVSVKPTISLALTAKGAPRIAMLAADDAMKRNLVYAACDAGCTDSAAWSATFLSDSEELGTGVDLALDEKGFPRIAHTYDYNIGIAFCGSASCTAADSPWDIAKVELGGEMDPDDIFLYESCNVGAWFLHSPSVAIGPDGHMRVGYQARDISGGWSNPDPATQRDCVAGTDMTWSRLAELGAL